MNRPEHDRPIASELQTLLQTSGLKPLRLGGRTLLPIVQARQAGHTTIRTLHMLQLCAGLGQAIS